MKLIINNRVRASIFFLVTMAAFAFYFGWYILNNPYIGINSVTLVNGKVIVQEVDTYGWGHSKGIQPGDSILRVNGINPTDHKIYKKFNVFESINTLEVKKANAKVKYFKVEKDLSTNQFIYHLAFPLLFFLVCVFLSTIVILKKIDHPASIPLITFFICLGLTYISSGASARGDMYSRMVNGIGLMAIPVLFLGFTSKYLSIINFILIKKRILISSYLFIMVIFIFTIIFNITGLMKLLFPNVYLISFSVFSLILFISLGKALVNAKNRRVKLTIMIWLVSLCVALSPFLLLYSLPHVISGQYILSAEVASIFILILPLSFFYILNNHHIFTLFIGINELRFNFLISLLPGIILTSIYIYFSKDLNLQQAFFILIISVLVITAFLYIKDQLDEMVGAKTIKKEYLNSLYTFLKEIQDFKNPEDVFKSISRTLESSFRLSVNIIEEQQTLNLQNTLPGSTININQVKWLVFLGNFNDHIYYLEIDLNNSLFDRYEKNFIETLVFLSHIKLENIYHIEDVISEIKQLNNKDVKTTKILNKMLFNIAEKERQELASDLHDTVLQDMLSILQEIQKISVNNRDKDPSGETFVHVLERMLDVIYILREICNTLRPPFLKELGLKDSLLNLLDKVRLRCNYTIRYTLLLQNERQLSHELTLTIYRVTQELLNNASKHSQCQNVDLDIRDDNQNIYLSYKDDGKGIGSIDFKKMKKQLGLLSIKERIHCLDGVFNIETKHGSGLKIVITIPLQKEDAKYDTYFVS